MEGDLNLFDVDFDLFELDTALSDADLIDYSFVEQLLDAPSLTSPPPQRSSVSPPEIAQSQHNNTSAWSQQGLSGQQQQRNALQWPAQQPNKLQQQEQGVPPYVCANGQQLSPQQPAQHIVTTGQPDHCPTTITCATVSSATHIVQQEQELQQQQQLLHTQLQQAGPVAHQQPSYQVQPLLQQRQQQQQQLVPLAHEQPSSNGASQVQPPAAYTSPFVMPTSPNSIFWGIGAVHQSTPPAPTSHAAATNSTRLVNTRPDSNILGHSSADSFNGWQAAEQLKQQPQQQLQQAQLQLGQSQHSNPSSKAVASTAKGRKGKQRAAKAAAFAAAAADVGIVDCTAAPALSRFRRSRLRAKQNMLNLELELERKLRELRLLSEENEQLKYKQQALEKVIIVRDRHIGLLRHYGPPAQNPPAQQAAAAAYNAPLVQQHQSSSSGRGSTDTAGASQAIDHSISNSAATWSRESVSANGQINWSLLLQQRLQQLVQFRHLPPQLPVPAYKALSVAQLMTLWKQYVYNASALLLQYEAATSPAARANAKCRIQELADRWGFRGLNVAVLNPAVIIKLSALDMETGQDVSAQDMHEHWLRVVHGMQLTIQQQGLFMAVFELVARDMLAVSRQRKALLAELQQVPAAHDAATAQTEQVASIPPSSNSSSSSISSTRTLAAFHLKAPLSSARVMEMLNKLQATIQRELLAAITMNGTLTDQVLDSVQACRVVVLSYPIFPSVLAMAVALAKHINWRPVGTLLSKNNQGSQIGVVVATGAAQQPQQQQQQQVMQVAVAGKQAASGAAVGSKQGAAEDVLNVMDEVQEGRLAAAAALLQAMQ